MAENDTIIELHTALVDACNGYDEAIKDAEPDVRALFDRAKSLHEQAHADIHAILTARGATPDDKGSFMSTVHKTVISIRSAVVGLDAGSLASFASGEKRIVETYDKAIQSNRDDGAVCDALQAQKTAVIELSGEMEANAAQRSAPQHGV